MLIHYFRIGSVAFARTTVHTTLCIVAAAADPDFSLWLRLFPSKKAGELSFIILSSRTAEDKGRSP
jgi:hypothetical protein